MQADCGAGHPCMWPGGASPGTLSLHAAESAQKHCLPSAGSPERTFGSELAAALTGLRPSPVARAAGLLHHVLLDNAACKQTVLQATSIGDREGPLLVRCCRQLANMLASGQQGTGFILIEQTS